jgi:hypothetical protein
MKNRKLSAQSTERAVTVRSKRWGAYAVAGVSLAATASSADGAIIFEVVNEVVANNSGGITTVERPMIGSSVLTFSHTDVGGAFGIASVAINNADSAGVVGFDVGSAPPLRYASMVTEGTLLSTLTFLDANGLARDLAYAVAGEFAVAGPAYIGFQFDAGGGAGVQLGWALVTMNGEANLNTFTWDSFAYTTAGEALRVGQISAIPEPGSLGVLALGAVGVAAIRRRRKLAVEATTA